MSSDDDSLTPVFEDVIMDAGGHEAHAEGCAPDCSDLAHDLPIGGKWQFDSELECALQVLLLPSVMIHHSTVTCSSSTPFLI
jgi:hypothetical protein